MFLRHESVAGAFSHFASYGGLQKAGKERRKRFWRILLPDVWDLKDGEFEAAFLGGRYLTE